MRPDEYVLLDATDLAALVRRGGDATGAAAGSSRALGRATGPATFQGCTTR